MKGTDSALAIERLAASGQFAFTLNYYAARGVKP